MILHQAAPLLGCHTLSHPPDPDAAVCVICGLRPPTLCSQQLHMAALCEGACQLPLKRLLKPCTATLCLRS